MGEMLSIEFNYRNELYSALVRCKIQKEQHLFQITIMNGKLEKILFGNHQFLANSKTLVAALECNDGTVQELQSAVAAGLLAYLEKTSWVIQRDEQPEVEYPEEMWS